MLTYITFKWNTLLNWCIQGYILNFSDLKSTLVCTSITTIQHIYFLIDRLSLDVFQSRFYMLGNFAYVVSGFFFKINVL